MKKFQNLKLEIFLLAALLLISFGSAATTSSYSRSNPNYGLFDSYASGSSSATWSTNQKVCSAGQDFILQIAPAGCTPAVVRSDLLEEQNVPVFCQIAATKINPLIDVKAIESISFSGQYSPEVSGVGFHPAKAALGVSGDLNNPVLNNIGYVVIVLKKQEVEAKMPEFVEGNLTARLTYDIQNAFGIGQASFYLPLLESSEWQQQKNKYSFWDGRGILKAEEIETNGAIVSVYNDVNRISSEKLAVGETSKNLIYLPGFDCLAGVRLRLDGLENPNTRAKLNVNGNVVEVIEGEKFLDNRCEVVRGSMVKEGINEKVTIKCQEDSSNYFFGNKNIPLEVRPRLSLNIDGVSKDYTIGDYLFDYGDKRAYLGFAGITKDKKLYAYIITISSSTSSNKLTNAEISSLAQYDKGVNSKTDIISAKDQINKLLSSAESGIRLGSTKLKGNDIQGISLEMANVFGKNIQIIGFSTSENIEITEEAKTYYDNSVKDYDTIISSFGHEPYSSTIEYREEALYQKIYLASRLKQGKTVLGLCEQFKKEYPESIIGGIATYCDNSAKLSSSESSAVSVMINGNVKDISFEGIYEPKFSDYGATIMIRGTNGQIKQVELNKGETYYLNDLRQLSEQSEVLSKVGEEYIQLTDLSDDSAKFTIRLMPSGFLASAKTYTISNSQGELKKNIANNLGSDFVFTLTNINLKKTAKVSVIPNIDNSGGYANFSFKIGIEKRAIQLSPEKTQEKINALNEKIADWESKSENLGTLVKTMKGACLATGAVLTVKNFLANTDGKAIARQNVMRGDGGFYEQCQKLVGDGKKYKSVEECLLDKSDEIDKAVDEMNKYLTEQNNQLKVLDKECAIDTNWEFTTETQVDTNCFRGKYLNESRDELKKLDSVQCGGVNVDIKTFVDGLKPEQISAEDLRILVLYSELKGTSLNSISSNRSKTIICDVYAKTKDENEKTSFGEKTGHAQYSSVISSKNLKTEISVSGNLKFKDIKSQYTLGEGSSIIGDDENVYFIKDKSQGEKEYLLVYDYTGAVKGTYAINGYTLSKYTGEGMGTGTLGVQNRFNEANPFGIGFKLYSSSSYTNSYENPEAKYYETEPYNGMPAVVPFDQTKGWYAYLKQTVPTGRTLATYDASGRVSSFYLCNVGENHKMDNMGGDDICQMINTGTGQPYNEFSGIENKQDVSKIVRVAIEAVNDATKQYKQGISKIRVKDLDGKYWYVKVGSPAVDLPDMQCQDFMSPEDCQWLFNLCDPVICPSSRCDFGGAYPVKDVIQSGIVGSILLCSPNLRKGIIIPVCLTGIKAGIDSLLSVYKSYRDCLQDSLDNGKMVGICDEVHSIYLCDFFWRQGLPIANLIIPKVLEMVFQQNVRGGGEYLGVASAWDTASKSVSYFTQYYAANSYKAFQSRTVEGVGEEVCKNFASGVYADGGSLLDQLTEPDSPAQFYGRFDEIPFTTATVPPTSQYKVFYHIYAGKDSRAYFEVYLKEGTTSSYYQDVSTKRLVDSGYIARGAYASQTKDFTAPSGYKQLCIKVNEQEECGFQQSSTSYAVNYVTDKYLQEQASATNIQSEEECISGSASIYSALNPNVQSAAENLINPQLYNQGIIRICATQNPGKGTDAKADTQGSRWIDVGKCSTDGKIRCWLDSNSVANVIKDTAIQNKTLSEINQYNQDVLANKEGYLGDAEVQQKISNIELQSDSDKLSSTTNLLKKVFWNKDKAKLLSIRGDAYGKLAIEAFGKLQASKIIAKGSATTSAPDNSGQTAKGSETNELEDRKNVNYYFQQWSEAQVIKTINYAKDNNLINRKCNCGNNCNSYAKLIVEFSDKYNIPDPLLLLSVMMQESSCDSDAFSGSSFGLMQISSWNLCKDSLNLRSIEDVKGANNVQNNIACGALILRKKYDEFNVGKTFQGCSNKNVRYYEWEAALRGYNGWSCGTDSNGNQITTQDKYVEEVIARYELLSGYLEGTTSGTATTQA